ncbi:MAG: 16S rRNA (guanine(527)-N(7))-methyltransferase RsmG [Bacteroidetes bacterium]|nr:16S rRNA (guanine(527)-N(7))-methyltransferase RsmG [Bacteroidota bacterium]
MDNLLKYFPNLSSRQQEQFAALPDLYAAWNAQINVISRKDIEHLLERHILHSLAIAKIITFVNGTKIMDVGTGGGFPGIPLAILFPEVEFLLVDSIGKKIKVVNEVATAIGLENVKGVHVRAEQIDEQFDFIVSRAVTALPEFMGWIAGKIKKRGINELENGVLYLKGGDLDAELIPLKQYWKVYNLKEIFDEPFFETKKVVHITGRI